MIDCLMSDLKQFVGSTPRADDISMFCLAGEGATETADKVDLKPSRTKQGADYLESIDRWSWSVELAGQSLTRIDPVAQAMSRLSDVEGDREEWQSVFTLLTELYVNALDHGILKLDSSLKHSAAGFAEYFDEREKRLQNLHQGSIRIDMDHLRSAEGGLIKIRITDTGDGFDYEKLLSDAQQEPSAILSGRGIKLVSHLGQCLRFSDHGRIVEVEFPYST